MSKLKIYNPNKNVLQAAQERIRFTFDHFESLYVSFSGGKDSTVMTHLVLEEAKLRNRKVGLLIIDLEAQYNYTIKHIEEMIDLYKDHIELYWVCLPLSLRNAVSNFEPKWVCWDSAKKADWVREMPLEYPIISEENNPFDFFVKGMEFEEFMVLFGEWYGGSNLTGGFVGIRTDESLNRFRTIASKSKKKYGSANYTTEVSKDLYNIYPIYDWRTEDIWKYHNINKDFCFNQIYDSMYRANMSIHEMRLCQPYGDDQRRGLWLYHILEPKTWYKVVARVNGVNSGSLYIKETGNMTGYNKITKPDHHTWESFTRLLLATLPTSLKGHYQERFRKFLKGWKGRGYTEGIPDEAPYILEKKQWAPSWRRLAKVLLRNDYWCKGLGFTQPKSAAYGKYLELKAKAKKENKSISDLDNKFRGEKE
jgi:predicted phosphoadenosine phosphosulfate sulfurtransferase